MSKPKIFVSYDYSNDRQYKNMLKAWDANKVFDLNFYDTSADVSIKSHDEGVIKRAISAKINSSDIVLCLIGSQSHKSKWVKWEIGKACELKKPIVAVKIEPTFKSPDEIKNVGARWALAFDFEPIKKAIEECTQGHSTRKTKTNGLNIIKGGGDKPVSIQPSRPWSI